MSGFDNEVIFAEGIDLTNEPGNISNQLATDGFVYLGNSAGRPQAALPTSSDGSIGITGGNGSLDLIVNRMPIGSTTNLGISYSSPTFTITSANGTALSATNPAWIVLPSVVNPGYSVAHKITANISFDDDSGTSDLTGNLWGTTTAVAWADIMPFFMYGVVKDADADATIMISRVPSLTVAPVAGKIAKSGSAVASTQGSFFAIDSGVTVGDYDGNSCALIGSFRMSKNDAGNDDWTVTTLTARDGIERFQERLIFGWPSDQNGAVSNALSSSVGGDTLPTFQDMGKGYSISKDGIIDLFWGWNNITGNGVGNGILRFHTPMSNPFSSEWYTPPGHFRYKNKIAVTYETLTISKHNSPTTYFEFIPDGTGTSKLTTVDLSTDKSEGGLTISYQVSES